MDITFNFGDVRFTVTFISQISKNLCFLRVRAAERGNCYQTFLLRIFSLSWLDSFHQPGKFWYWVKSSFCGRGSLTRLRLMCQLFFRKLCEKPFITKNSAFFLNINICMKPGDLQKPDYYPYLPASTNFHAGRRGCICTSGKAMDSSVACNFRAR